MISRCRAAHDHDQAGVALPTTMIRPVSRAMMINCAPRA
jgi:hypothetical protein